MRNEPTIDHDRLFKELLTTFFTEFVEAFLPDAATYLDRSSVVFLDKELFTDVTEGQKYESDMVVQARFAGQETYFLLFVENQSTAQSRFPKRMFTYFARLHEKYDLPVYPIALFSYDAPERPEPDGYQVALPGFMVCDFHYRAIQLNRLTWRDYVASPNPAATALMAKMQIAPEDRPKVKAQCLRLIATLRLDAARSHLIAGFVESYLRLSAAELVVFEQELSTIPATERAQMLTLTNQWIEQGIERGIEQGIEQGEVRVVKRQLERKLGTQVSSFFPQVEALPLSQIELLSDALLDFTTMKDLESWLETLKRETLKVVK